MLPIARHLVAFCFLAPISLFAQPPAGYYDAAQGLTGEPLRAALHNIIDNHDVIGYNSLWANFFTLDRKPNGKIWDIYSDIPGGTPPYEYAFGSDQCGEYSGEGDCYNREHSFPQSWFNNASPMVSDLFHIYPTDGWVNGKRGDLAYGEVGSPTYTSLNGSKRGPCSFPGCDTIVFEPIDAYKGDLARGYFYMLTRYLGQTQSWSSPMMLGGQFRPWAESMLVSWHLADPVSQKEIDRNNKIFTTAQHNRNPYIDQPGWVQQIWGSTASVPEQRAGIGRVWKDNHQLQISLGKQMAKGLVHIHDGRGTLVKTVSFTGDQTTISMDVAAGIYLIILDTEAGRQVQKLVW